MVMSCSFNIAYAPYGPHQGLSNLVFSLVALNLKFGNGMLYPYLHIFDGFFVAGKHIEFGVQKSFLLLLFCYNAATNYNLENLTRELSHVYVFTAGFHRISELPTGCVRGNL